MTTTRPRRAIPLRRALLALVLGAAVVPAAQAQGSNWPSKPIKVVVNFPPGGAADTIARAISQPLQDALGQPVLIENRGGANGNIGGENVARALPDGYTLLMSSGGMVSVNPHLYPKMSFDPTKDLIPVAAAARVLVFLVTKPSLPPQNVKDFIAYVKERPGKLSFGSPGTGSSPHLAGEMFKSQTGLFAVHVPYRGAAPALQDLLAGQIDFSFDPGIGLQPGARGQAAPAGRGQPEALAAVPGGAHARRGWAQGLRRRHGVRLLRARAHAARGRDPAQHRDQPHPGDAGGEGAHCQPGRRSGARHAGGLP